MKKNIQSIFIISCAMVISLALCGCSSSKTKQETAPATSTTALTNQTIADSTSVDILSDNSAEAEAKPITITVINLSEADVGMFSVFDPMLDQQIDVNEIASDGTLTFSCDWPVDIKDLQWAVYDTQGELLLESTTDLTECKELVSILLSGEDTIDDVDVLFD